MRNSRLLQYSGKQILTDLSYMEIGKRQTQTSFYQKLVFPARMRSLKTNLLQHTDQVLAFDRTKGGHVWSPYASAGARLIPATTGRTCPIRRPTISQSSSTLCNSSRQASSESVFAHTP